MWLNESFIETEVSRVKGMTKKKFTYVGGATRRIRTSRGAAKNVLSAWVRDLSISIPPVTLDRIGV